MFENIAVIARELRGELLSVYWILIVPLVVFLTILEFVKEDQQPISVVDILRRTIISILLLVSFEEVMQILSFLSDGILQKLDQKNNFMELMKNFGPSEASKSNEWFNLREHLLYLVSILAYIIAYLGFFFAEACTHFVWAVLYIVSPLMILAYIPRQTAFVTSNLYKSLIQVVLWRILWSILGALLLRLAVEPQFTGFEDYLQSVVINLCVGISMLLIPVATKSLINDGFASSASAMTTTGTKLALKLLKAKTLGATPTDLPGQKGNQGKKPNQNNFKNRYQSDQQKGDK